jgi:predicted transcriptional regulator
MINEGYLDAEISEELGITRQMVSKIRAEVKQRYPDGWTTLEPL